MTVEFVRPSTQQVMDFATAKMTAAEIEEQRRKLEDAVAEVERLAERVKCHEVYIAWQTAKERVKELRQIIEEGTSALTRGLVGEG